MEMTKTGDVLLWNFKKRRHTKSDIRFEFPALSLPYIAKKSVL